MSKLTAYISTNLKGRQEEAPLLGKYFDLARCEPLHLKNNTVKKMFMKILKIVLSEANLAKEIKLFKEIPASNIFFRFVDFVKTELKSSFLRKKIIAWFNENILSKQEREFCFRFQEEESHNCLKGFASLILMLKLYFSEQNLTHLLQVHYESLCFCKLVSHLDVSEMISVRQKLFRAYYLYDSSISASMWCFSMVAPVHWRESIEKLNLGLGINTLEDWKQKHQVIKKYSDNATVQDRWSHIFRHQFIELVYLREHGFDLNRYRK